MTPDLGNVSAMWRNQALGIFERLLSDRTLKCDSGTPAVPISNHEQDPFKMMSLHPYPPFDRSRYLCRFLKIGVLECRRHPVDFGVLDAHLLGGRAPFRNRAARLTGDFPGG
jgi:hypothetical protein